MNSLDRVLKKHEKTIKRKNANLDEISNDIKKVELFLTNSGMKHPFIMEIPFTNEELFLEFKITELNPKKDLEILYLLTKEGILKQELGEFYTQKQALNRFSIAALITSDSIVDTLRKTLRKIDSEIRVDADQIKTVILQEVLKREVIEGEKAEEAQKKINRALNRIYKNRSSKEDDDESVLNKAISQSMAQNNQLAA